MTETLQNVLVLVAVAAAVLWLVADRVRRRRTKSKCDGCGLAQAVSRRDESVRPRR